jgi:hypothetical protein
MPKLDTLTKPRFSILHVVTYAVAFAITLIVASAIFNHWSDFKSGLRDGYARAAAR